MLEIIPLISVGPFKFKEPIDKYLKEYPPEKVSHIDKFGSVDLPFSWTTYCYYNDCLILNVENGIIENITIEMDCMLNRKNIYNIDVHEFFNEYMIKKQEQKIDDEYRNDKKECYSIYEIDSLGLQLWVNDLNYIVTIICDDGGISLG